MSEFLAFIFQNLEIERRNKMRNCKRNVIYRLSGIKTAENQASFQFMFVRVYLLRDIYTGEKLLVKYFSSYFRPNNEDCYFAPCKLKIFPIPPYLRDTSR